MAKSIKDRAKEYADNYIVGDAAVIADLLHKVAEESYKVGATDQHKINIKKACEWLKQCTTFQHPDYRHPVPYFTEDDIEDFKSVIEK